MCEGASKQSPDPQNSTTLGLGWGPHSEIPGSATGSWTCQWLCSFYIHVSLKYLFCFGVLIVVVGGGRGGSRGMCEWGFSLSWRCMRMSVWQGGLTGNYGFYFHYLSIINLKQYRTIVIDLIFYVYLKFLIDVFIS